MNSWLVKLANMCEKQIHVTHFIDMLYSSGQVVIGFYNKIKIIKHGMIVMATSLDHFGHLIGIIMFGYMCVESTSLFFIHDDYRWIQIFNINNS
jgi:hypothetical protein